MLRNKQSQGNVKNNKLKLSISTLESSKIGLTNSKEDTKKLNEINEQIKIERKKEVSAQEKLETVTKKLDETNRELEKIISEIRPLRITIIKELNLADNLDAMDKESTTLKRAISFQLGSQDLLSEDANKLKEDKFKLEKQIADFQNELKKTSVSISSEQQKLKNLEEKEANAQKEILKYKSNLLNYEKFLEKILQGEKDGNVYRILDQLDDLLKNKSGNMEELKQLENLKSSFQKSAIELQELKGFKTKWEGVVSKIQQAREINKMVLVTATGVVTTSINELRKELLTVTKKREELESNMPLPDGWEKRFDVNNGRPYYVK
jgi:chromosome segregation ATPase